MDVPSRIVTHTVQVGAGPSGIAVWGDTAVVANLQAGSLSIVNLTDFTASTVPLSPGSRPHEVAISAAGQAVLTNPMSNGVLLYNLATKAVTSIDLGASNRLGPGAVVTNGSFAYVANQMTGSITVLDLTAGAVTKTFPVDPGPRSLALDAAKNHLLVLAEGTGTVDVVDLSTFAILTRLNAGEGDRQGTWAMPWITSMSPGSAAVGSTFTLTLVGSNLQQVHDVEFHLAGGAGGGMMGGDMGMGSKDDNIRVSAVQSNTAGTELRATVQILPAAAPGARQVRLETSWGEVMGLMFNSLFTVTAR